MSLTHIVGIVGDNLLWLALVAVLFLCFSPVQTWLLLKENRPGRGSGWKLWLADRYIQIWLARGPIDSSSNPFGLRMPMGLGGSWNDRPIATKLIDERLEKYWLVRRSGDTVIIRKESYIFLCNWLTYVLCKWYLIVFCGDTQKYYEEIATPPSRINKAISDAVTNGFKRFITIIAMLAFTFVMLKIMALLLPYIPKLLTPLLNNIQVPEIKIPHQ